MSDSEDEHTHSAKSYFLKHQFDGARMQWREFEEEIRNAVRSTKGLGTNAWNYLDGDWDWDADAHEWTDMPLIYQRVAVPDEIPGDIGTPEERSANRAEIMYYKKRNREVDDIITGCYHILSSRVNKDLVASWRPFNHEPILCWRVLKDDFSDATLSDLNKGAYFIDFIADTMKSSDKFSTFITRFERLADLLQLPDRLRLGILVTDGKNRIQLQMLPDRLKDIVKQCRTANMDYEDSKQLLYDQDQLQ